jgi:hypothetical protein
MRIRAEQCRHNIREGETVRNVLLVVFMAAILPAPRSIASTNLSAGIDADVLNKLETAGIALDGDINESASGPVDKMIP